MAHTEHMRIVVLTGAGISAESGLPTFRDADGLWEGHDPMTVATPEAFEDDPDLVHRFYDERRALLARAEPNAAHRALARLEAEMGSDLYLVTQNIDDLHERAGSRRVHHMHGRLRAAWCTECDARSDWEGELRSRPPCPQCGASALRPDVVWFGEMAYNMEAVDEAIFNCDMFVAIGTSGVVYPAAAFVHYALGNGKRTVELNLDISPASSDFHDSRRGHATTLVPAWVEEILG